MDSGSEVSVQEVKRLLDSGEQILLLDVRQPAEHRVAHIAGNRLIPLNELPKRAGELAPYTSRPIIVYCHLGIRSLHATEFLRANGFADVRSMSGGIDAWSREIDPALPRY